MKISPALLPVMAAVVCLAGSINEACTASLTIVRAGCAATITWTNTADVLETNSTLGSASWAPVTGASSPYPVSTCGAGVNFYRLKLAGGGTLYSDNIVGYMNVAVPQGFTLIANQVDNLPDNSLQSLFPNGTTPDRTVVYKWDGYSGFGFSSWAYDAGLGGWVADGSAQLNPGEGAFIFAPVAFTATFIGQVRTGTNSIVVPSGVFSILSSVIPQAGALHDPVALGHVDLQYGTPGGSEVFYQFDNSAGGYNSYLWDPGLVAWGDPNAAGPNLKVGESLFIFSLGGGGSHIWTRQFIVGPP